MNLLEVVESGIPCGWEQVFKDGIYELQDIAKVLWEQEQTYGRFYPDKIDIFRLFHLIRPEKVRVIIVAQDPYYNMASDGRPEATGVALSVRPGVKIPSSLQNIHKEIENTVTNWPRPNHGSLESWVHQGVALLNMSLTVRPGAPASHGKIWHGFLKRAINEIFRKRIETPGLKRPQIIIVMWGRDAQGIGQLIDKSYIPLEAAHPSGRSAHRGFFGCNHFNKVNEHLVAMGDTPIDWTIPPVNYQVYNTMTPASAGIIQPQPYGGRSL